MSTTQLIAGAWRSRLRGSVAWAGTPVSVGAGASATQTVTVTGAAIGDVVVGVSHSVALGGLVLSGEVTAADTVTVTARNPTGGSLNVNAGTVRVRVEKD
jgi:hypothetical protein